MKKQIWFNWHSWLGIKLAVLLCFILVTGTLAVISHEIDWLTNSAKRVIPLTNTSQVKWSNIYLKANELAPQDIVTSISAPIDPWFAAEVVLLTPEGKRYRQFFHPQTAEFQGVGRWYNWQRFFRMTHRHLMMPTQIGITIVCLFAFLMLFSAISGTVIYPKWWRGFFRKPRTQNTKVFWNDIHRLLGLWSLWLLIIICLTGIWYFVEIWGGRAPSSEQKSPSSVIAQTRLVKPQKAVIEKMIEQTSARHPTLVIKQIRFPSIKNRPVVIMGQDPTLLVRDRASNATFDPFSGELLLVKFAINQSLHVRISEAADPLHFGYFAGIYSKLVYFIFGIILSGLAITGTYLYGLHYTRGVRHQPIVAKSIWRTAWLGMAWGKWLSSGLITVCLSLTMYVFFIL